MILLITYTDRDKYTGIKGLFVSHGIDLETDLNVVLPQVPLSCFNAIYDPDFGEWFI